MSEKIIHKELSYRVNGCIFDVHNEVGPGVREECYQRALEHRLAQAGIPFYAKPRTRSELVHQGEIVSVFEPDLLLPEWMILELKHQPEGLCRDNFTQVLNYLKFFDLRLGLLVNFAMDKAVIERVPYEPNHAEAEENYDYLREVTDQDRPLLRYVREALLEINREMGVGYSATVYRSAALVEFRARGLRCDSEPQVTPVFRERRLPRSPITPILVERRICVQIEAICDAITARAVRTMQTHLRMTGCDVGIIACFGKTKFLISGVRR